MQIQEIVVERRAQAGQNVRVPLRQQILQIIQKNGGTIDDYWVSSTTVDHLGFYGGDSHHPQPEKTRPGRAFDVPMGAFQDQRKYSSPEYATYGGAAYWGDKPTQQRYGLWFMPLKKVFKQLEMGQYPYLRNFLFLVRLRDTAWLQPVDNWQKLRAAVVGIRPPSGKSKVGQYNPESNIAVFFKPAYQIVGKWTRAEIENSARRAQIGGPEAQKRVGQERAARRAAQQQRLRQELDDLF